MTRSRLRSARLPRSVVFARVLLGVVCAYHLFIAALTATQVRLLHRELAAAHPGLTPSAVDHATNTAVVTAVAVHVPLFLLTGFLAIALTSGHPWVLRPATVSQLFAIGFATLSTPPFPALQPLIPVMIAVEIGVIALLWVPSRSREFFASHPRSRRSVRLAAGENSAA